VEYGVAWLVAVKPQVEAIGTFIGVVAIIPSVAWFLINQEGQRRARKEDRYRYVGDQYQSYLEKCLAHPNLSLETGNPRPVAELRPDELLQRDVMFDVATSMFESVFLAYAHSWTSHRQEQWKGWDRYIENYCNRRLSGLVAPGYTGGTLGDAMAGNMSQYDTRFEVYLSEKMNRLLGIPRQNRAARKRGWRAIFLRWVNIRSSHDRGDKFEGLAARAEDARPVPPVTAPSPGSRPGRR
jgi:hypothetical protein